MACDPCSGTVNGIVMCLNGTAVVCPTSSMPTSGAWFPILTFGDGVPTVTWGNAGGAGLPHPGVIGPAAPRPTGPVRDRLRELLKKFIDSGLLEKIIAGVLSDTPPES